MFGHFTTLCIKGLKTYSESSQTCKMELFAKIFNGLQLLTIFLKSLILDFIRVWPKKDLPFTDGRRTGVYLLIHLMPKLPSHRISHLICSTNQLIGFYMMTTLALNEFNFEKIFMLFWCFYCWLWKTLDTNIYFCFELRTN